MGCGRGFLGPASQSGPSTASDAIAALPALSAQQQVVVSWIMTGANTFLTGPAGSGKSLVLSHLTRLLAQPRSAVGPSSLMSRGLTTLALTAPTGISAVLIGGCTAHSWTAVGLGQLGLLQYQYEFRPPPLPRGEHEYQRPVSEGKIAKIDQHRHVDSG